MTNNRLVIIHDTDADGIAAAWCINRGFREEYSDVLLVPQRAGENIIPEGLLQTDSVYMVDRTYPWDTLIALSQQVFAVTVIDHHKSAMDEYKKVEAIGVCFDSHTLSVTASSLLFDYTNITVNIDTNHSACMLAHLWVVEHSTDPDIGLVTPWFIQYIEDRDIWKWSLPDSKEINAGLYYYGHTFNNYDTYYMSCTPAFEHNRLSDISFVKNTGSIVLQTQLNLIKSIAHGPTVGFKQLIVEECWTTGMPPKRCPFNDRVLNFAIVCVPFTLISDFGNYCLNYTEDGTVPPDVVLCYNETDKGFTYSIRSKYDMIWLAKMFDGGGHPFACGFTSVVQPNSILEVVKFKLTNPDLKHMTAFDDDVPSPDNTAELTMQYDMSEVETTLNPDIIVKAFSDLPL